MFFEFQERVWAMIDSFQEQEEIQPRTTESEKAMFRQDLLKWYKLGWKSGRVVTWLYTFEEVDPRVEEDIAFIRRETIEGEPGNIQNINPNPILKLVSGSQKLILCVIVIVEIPKDNRSIKSVLFSTHKDPCFNRDQCKLA